MEAGAEGGRRWVPASEVESNKNRLACLINTARSVLQRQPRVQLTFLFSVRGRGSSREGVAGTKKTNFPNRETRQRLAAARQHRLRGPCDKPCRFHRIKQSLFFASARLVCSQSTLCGIMVSAAVGFPPLLYLERADTVWSKLQASGGGFYLHHFLLVLPVSWQLLAKGEVVHAWKGALVLSASHCLCLLLTAIAFHSSWRGEKDTLKYTLSKWRLRLAWAWPWDSLHLLSTQGVAANDIVSIGGKKAQVLSFLIDWVACLTKHCRKSSRGQICTLITRRRPQLSHSSVSDFKHGGEGQGENYFRNDSSFASPVDNFAWGDAWGFC